MGKERDEKKIMSNPLLKYRTENPLMKYRESNSINEKKPTNSLMKTQEQKSSEQEEAYNPKGFSGIGRDALESIISAPGAALKGIMNLPEHIKSGGEYSKKEPWYKSAGQLGLGGAEGVAGLLSSPQVAGRYLSEKFGSPKGKFNKSLHETPTPFELLQDYEKELDLDASKKGESELRALGQLLLAKKGLTKVPSKTGRIGTVSASAAGEGGDPIHAALGSLIAENAIKGTKKAPEWIETIKNKKGLDEKIINSDEELAARESALKTAEAEAGASSPEALKVQSGDLEQQITDLESQLNDTTEKSKNLNTNTQKMIPDLRHETNLNNAVDLLGQSKQNINAAHEAQGMQLGAGQDFSERASPLITEGIEGVKNEIRPLYNAVDENLRQNNVIIPNSQRATEIQNAMNGLINNGTLSPENDAIYERILNQLEEQWGGEKFESIPAADFVQIYKSTRDLHRIARSRSREGGIQADERRRWELKARELEPVVHQQRELLREAIPTTTFNNLAEADRLWGRQVIPFYNNKVYREVMKEGSVPNNMIDDTHGTTRSNRVMQELIRSNPELNRLALGQNYANKPRELFNYNERTKPYIEAHEPTLRSMQVQENAMQSGERAQNVHDTALERAHAARERQSSIASEDQEKQTAIEKESKELENKKEKLKADIKKLTESLEKNKINIKKLEDEIEKHGKTKARNEQLKKYKEERDGIKNKLWTIASIGIGYLTGKNVVESIFKALFK